MTGHNGEGARGKHPGYHAGPLCIAGIPVYAQSCYLVSVCERDMIRACNCELEERKHCIAQMN